MNESLFCLTWPFYGILYTLFIFYQASFQFEIILMLSPLQNVFDLFSDINSSNIKDFLCENHRHRNIDGNLKDRSSVSAKWVHAIFQ